MKCKKVQEFLPKFREWIPTTLILGGALVTIYGIAKGSSPFILGGSYALGWGFYLKANRSSDQNLSHYGHFMLGLAALITLPQTPEILSKITDIKDGVYQLAEGRKSLDKAVEGLIKSQEEIKSTEMKIGYGVDELKKSQEDIKNLIVNHTNVPQSLGKEVKIKTDKEIFEEIRKLIRDPAICEDKNGNLKGRVSMPSNVPSSSLVYLSNENARKIIKTLEHEGVTRENVELLLQKHLDVWRPAYDSSKCRKAPQ